MSPVNPSDKEQEYFARQEMERRQREQKEQSEKMAAEEKKRLKELHWMRCPKDGMELAEFEFRGIKLDRCGQCGGVWFDPGEMEEMLSREDDFFSKLKTFFG